MKRVTFKVAKALKEVGYSQGNTPYQYVTKDYSVFKEGEMIDAFYENWAGDNVIDAPLVMDVWLWLWEEKKFIIELQGQRTTGWSTPLFPNRFFHNQEQAIIASIDYLVEHNLIK